MTTVIGVGRPLAATVEWGARTGWCEVWKCVKGLHRMAQAAPQGTRECGHTVFPKLNGLFLSTRDV